jgi:uncharacterized membrane protein YoaK (UPF0700 family)
MFGFPEKTLDWALSIVEPGRTDKTRWQKTVIKLFHLSLWLGFLAGAIIGI